MGHNFCDPHFDFYGSFPALVAGLNKQKGGSKPAFISFSPDFNSFNNDNFTPPHSAV